MPRRIRESKRRHAVTLDVLSAIASHDKTSWESFWGGRREAKAAFESLREDAEAARLMELKPGDTYETWLRRWSWSAAMIAAMDPREPAEPARARRIPFDVTPELGLPDPPGREG